MQVNTKVLLLLGCFTGYLVAGGVLIELPDGRVKGRIDYTATRKMFYSFFGIPYAQPPVGNLRFQAPQPVESWDGVFDATYQKNICYQVPSDAATENEDCLFINVFTPNDPASNSSLPVMFFIYGGGFVSGSSERLLYGTYHFMEHEVIIVTFNYRVGPFGFFSTGDSVIPGNAGLKDQNLALQWVQKNIEYFGGDPDKVTIFGESAGAASVAYHILSPKSKGLFRAAILESGSALSPWAYQRNQVEYTFGTAGYIDPSLNNGSTTSSQLLEYLITVPARAIDTASANFSTDLETPENLQIQQGFYYAPVIEHDHEDAFITERMYESLRRGEFNKVPVIIGENSEESLWWFGDLMDRIIQEFDNNHSLLLPLGMNTEDDKIEKAGEAIKNLYSPYADFAEDPVLLYKYFSDQSFIRSIIKHAEIQSKFTDVYFYQFSYGGELGCNLKHSVNGSYDSVRHGEELFYLFARFCPRTLLYSKGLTIFPDEDVLVFNRFITMYTNFAKTLNPTPEKSELLENIIWPKFNDGEFSYLDIGSSSVVRQHPRNSTYDAWNAIYEK